LRVAASIGLCCSLGFAAPLKTDANETNRVKYPAPIEKMVGQMIVIGFEGKRSSEAGAKLVMGRIKKGEIGGVVLYARNIDDPMQLEAFTRALHYSIGSNPPLWIMIDQEGGKIQRLNSQKGFSDYPSAKKVGAGTPNAAYATYRDLACELRGYGINFNLAPVVDLDRGEGVIASDQRGFDSDGQKVAKFAEQFIKAHDSCGILTALKHFPGHGGAIADPHIESASATIQTDDLIPFTRLIDSKKARAVMMAHIIDPSEGDLPASLSAKQISRLRALGFDGTVISDDLQMGAIARNFDLNQTVALAINAGNDILLFSNMLSYDPEVPDKVLAIVKAAIDSGEIDPRRIIDSYNRIIALKNKRLP
jgi:beta-N-acetylhexosaminidase